MRITDNRYAAELAKFDLAVRMIGHEARTGTIRACTGFSEDRIRKIYSSYFKLENGNQIKRRRGKSPTQITPFINSSERQSEATIIGCLLLLSGVIDLGETNGTATAPRLDPVVRGNSICDVYETYCEVHSAPSLCFERTCCLYNALAVHQELFFASCGDCGGLYIQDRYALDYQRCPFCEIKFASRAA